LVKEIPVINKIIGENCEVSMITAFAVVFAVGLIIASLFTPLFSSVIRRSFLSGIDQGLGFVFGAVRGIALVGAAFLIYGMAHQSIDMVEKSRAKTVFDNFNGGIQSAIPDDLLNMVLARYNDLTASCQPTTTAPAADTTAPATTN
jgi:membrane protein required for colicin V production